MKLTILGGGGFRVPLVYKALIADEAPGRVTELRLYDTDETRLGAIRAVLDELAAEAQDPPKLISTTDLGEALAGTDFIFSAIRVGGAPGRALDEKISLSHGVIGQETVGAGGISYALRGIPAVLKIVEAVKEHAPDAYFINFTNPAGVITEVLRKHLGDRVVGICDSPVGMARRVLDVLKGAGLVAADVPNVSAGSGRVKLKYAGLNHLGWLTGLHVDGEDVLPKLFERPDLIESFEEGRLFGADLIQALKAVPNEYLHYYYFPREAFAVDSVSDKTRGRFLAEQQKGFYEKSDDGLSAHERWDRTRLEREQTYMATNREAAGNFERDEADLETGGYDKVALAIMHAIANDTPVELILNVANNGALPDLDDAAVVEIPCRVDASGVAPLAGAKLPDHGRGLVINAKYVERRTIDAALNQSRDDALLALSHHPLVDSFHVAEELLADLVAAFPEDLAYLSEDPADDGEAPVENAESSERLAVHTEGPYRSNTAWAVALEAAKGAAAGNPEYRDAVQVIRHLGWRAPQEAVSWHEGTTPSVFANSPAMGVVPGMAVQRAMALVVARLVETASTPLQREHAAMFAAMVG